MLKVGVGVGVGVTVGVGVLVRVAVGKKAGGVTGGRGGTTGGRGKSSPGFRGVVGLSASVGIVPAREARSGAVVTMMAQLRE